ncbi:MAG TPA: hypothetical protein PLU39_13545 [Armatimonadota bacterium]|jgi:hypothetical protein|nr:hypothetical protein [Armatimonadota bacterium]HOM81896.1 hypothetical protein [Armatimonadota bacterium]HPO71894.1 hypothetical protein [Armatimonadota bacterium]HPT98886.1 hypothetical protein [Armatimonadota bacterium]
MTDEQLAQLATLTPEEERRLREVEDEMGDVYLIAYEKPLVPAPLDEEKLRRLQDVEREMPGRIVVAYKRT